MTWEEMLRRLEMERLTGMPRWVLTSAPHAPEEPRSLRVLRTERKAS